MGCRAYFKSLPVGSDKMFQAIETASKSYIGNGLLRGGQQYFGVIKPNACKILVGRNTHDRFENAAKMKWTHQTVPGYLL